MRTGRATRSPKPTWASGSGSARASGTTWATRRRARARGRRRSGFRRRPTRSPSRRTGASARIDSIHYTVAREGPTDRALAVTVRLEPPAGHDWDANDPSDPDDEDDPFQ